MDDPLWKLIEKRKIEVMLSETDKRKWTFYIKITDTIKMVKLLIKAIIEDNTYVEDQGLCVRNEGIPEYKEEIAGRCRWKN